MKYSIIFSPDAKESLDELQANLRSLVKQGIIEYLSHEPERVTKSRIKKLRGIERPQYRLRINDIRIYYDIVDNQVEILTIITKEQALDWLERHGK